MGGMETLPPELLQIILNFVADDYNPKSEPTARAGYASVCKAWRRFFEPINFQHLVLDQDRVYDMFQYMASSERRSGLKHLFLRLKLNEYDCKVCQSKEDEKTIRDNDEVFTQSLWTLLSVLSQWSIPNEDGRQHKLTLELGMYSPSDNKHTFKDLRLADNYPHQEEQNLQTYFEANTIESDNLGLATLHDPDHGWIHGSRENINLEARKRILGTVTYKSPLRKSSESTRKFPKVDVVTDLLIRRQFCRKVAATSLRKIFHESFIGLQTFRHEEWHDVDPKRQIPHEKAYYTLLSLYLPSTLRNLYIFEESNEVLHPERYGSYGRLVENAIPALGKVLSKSSRHLENLSAAFLIDAKDFFAQFWIRAPLDSAVLPWSNLQTLALTSRLLHPKIKQYIINKMLMAAARAAAFMPKLEIMEIWNGSTRNICVFRYEHRNETGKSQITWASTWGPHGFLCENVVQCWAASLSGQGRILQGELTSVVVRLPRKRAYVKSFASAIPFLKLRGRIWNSISAFSWNMRRIHAVEGTWRNSEANIYLLWSPYSD